VFECTSSDGSHFERTVAYVPDGVMYEVLVDQVNALNAALQKRR
jgi:hypothetical protein